VTEHLGRGRLAGPGAVGDLADVGVVVAGQGNAYTLASAVTETLPNVKLLSPPGSRALRWSELVNEERELWPVEFLLPGGAYVH